VLAQSYPHFEIVVVDDGSTDDTPEVAARYPAVRRIRQNNQGLAAARNSGIRESRGSYLVFLDADDRLLPQALELGVQCLEAHPECAFVSGHHRNTTTDGAIRQDQPPPLTTVDENLYVALLQQGNIMGSHATVMYRRAVLEFVGGFDSSLKACEDYDLYFRITKDFPVCSYDDVVAEYRQHDSNMSGNPALMLKTAMTVLRSQRAYVRKDKRYQEAYKIGVKSMKEFHGVPLARRVLAHARKREWKQAMQDMLVLLPYCPRLFVRAWRKLELPMRLRHWLRATPPVGRVDFGSLRRLRPVSRVFGYDRGHPIDRYYIENFLSRQAKDIRGRVLEIKDDTYTRKYGGSRVEVSDVLDVVEDNPQATIVADLTDASHISSDAFDCIVCTQTLHVIYDLRSAVLTLHRILKPGGILLVTVPGVSQIEQDTSDWHWSFTTRSVRRLFEEAFPATNLTIESYGNVLAAVSFLHGLSVQELTQEELDYRDPQYELLITLRAVKPETTS
jgi:glycosyltransferase involved in cell wall biosynthesis